LFPKASNWEAKARKWAEAPKTRKEVEEEVEEEITRLGLVQV